MKDLLSNVLKEINGISGNVWTGYINNKNGGCWFNIDSDSVIGCIEIDQSSGETKLVYNFYHKRLDIISVGKTNLCEAYTGIRLKLKALHNEIGAELKKL